MGDTRDIIPIYGKRSKETKRVMQKAYVQDEESRKKTEQLARNYLTLRHKIDSQLPTYAWIVLGMIISFFGILLIENLVLNTNMVTWIQNSI